MGRAAVRRPEQFSRHLTARPFAVDVTPSGSLKRATVSSMASQQCRLFSPPRVLVCLAFIIVSLTNTPTLFGNCQLYPVLDVLERVQCQIKEIPRAARRIQHGESP